MALIEEFEPVDELVCMDTEELAAFISEKVRNHFESPEEVTYPFRKSLYTLLFSRSS